ncbi:glycerol-3-phosphate dehydrogenase [Vineibacter terrae]|uniref:Glycerol-3-phosphate dehydrogenase n=1 Tax=Vineibacter terrae TaxID=2586908 RepID=A0A5C8P9K1_9HYPH|nr:glycerol-3-phosphate dehydrogenase [Vineibacter terrae]TXL70498.1 glycerol-3-phosphate dehydrogenase [Vineibacter terrae]
MSPAASSDSPAVLDLFVVGGGVNGAGIACDANGRGLKVGLCEMNDFASATSSASSKLIHGGLRYLEHYEFRLVREALKERELLLAKMPHLSWPLRFVLPHEPHLRPRWMLRVGLFIYDHLDRRMRLPKTESVRLQRSPYGAGLKPDFGFGFVYSDGWVDDARLVIGNLKSAANRGARIFARHKCVAARRIEAAGRRLWQVTLEEAATGRRLDVQARGLVNATGPWVRQWFDDVGHVATRKRVRLVKGSHIVVPKLHDGDHAFILQNDDKRIVFVIPYEREFSLIGTTDIELDTYAPGPVAITPEEVTYLCTLSNHYMQKQITPADVVWSYAGVRPLFDDGTDDPSAVTRDYVLEIDAADGQAPLLSVFGGKITTYRKLAEHAMDDLGKYYPSMGGRWTDQEPLPDGEMPHADFDGFARGLIGVHPGLPQTYLWRLARRHGAGCDDLLGTARTPADLGRHFGGDLYEIEVDHLIRHEWAREPDDVLWRRTKEGLHMTQAQRQAFADWMTAQRRDAA